MQAPRSGAGPSRVLGVMALAACACCSTVTREQARRTTAPPGEGALPRVSASTASALRVMNAFRARGERLGARHAPVFSPSDALLPGGDPATPSRGELPGAGLEGPRRETVDVSSLRAAGYAVVPYTVDDPARMRALLRLGVSGIITDRPDLAFAVVASFDANSDGTPGDLLGDDGLLDPAKLDVQGHRGARDLRPENTLPAMEAALDHLATTLETDVGITADGVPVLDHDPQVDAQKCRRADGAGYEPGDAIRLDDTTSAELRRLYVCDRTFRGREQKSDPSLSPVASAFARSRGLPHLYVMPTLPELFAFVHAYEEHYASGPGKGAPGAALRARNAGRVRFDVETKVSPRADLRHPSIPPELLARIVAETIVAHGQSDRAEIQSFDVRTLLHVQEHYPEIRTVYLFDALPVRDGAPVDVAAPSRKR